ncbi:hypothetical protein HMI54_012907, partial [Coelomomyces lativittatus]
MIPNYKVKRQPQPIINPLLYRNCKPYPTASNLPGAFTNVQASQTSLPKFLDTPFSQEVVSVQSSNSAFTRDDTDPHFSHANPSSLYKINFKTILKDGKEPLDANKTPSILFKSQEKILSTSVENIKGSNKALEPKVLRPFVPEHGKTPRRIEIKRKKVLYASQDISAILENFHVYPSDLASAPIPFHLFDNTDFDSREVVEWLNMDVPALQLYKKRFKFNLEPLASKMDLVDASIPVPAKVFVEKEWISCHVTGYKKSTMEWR